MPQSRFPRDRHSDDLLTMTLAARRRRSTKYAPPPSPEPTPEQEARADYLKSLTAEALQVWKRCANEFAELEAVGRLYQTDVDRARESHAAPATKDEQG